MSNIYNLFYERYSIIHQPTYELVLVATILGNLFASAICGYYITKKYSIYPIQKDIYCKIDTVEMGEALYEGEDKFSKPETVTMLKDCNKKRKSVITKIYFAQQDYFRKKILPVHTPHYYPNKCL